MSVSTFRKTAVRRVERNAVLVEEPRRGKLFGRDSLRWRGNSLTLRRSEIALAHVTRSNAGWHMRVTGDGNKTSDPMSRESATEAAEVIVLQFLNNED
jgi:hypothetical protein